jgi:nicotinamidase-related amidase
MQPPGPTDALLVVDAQNDSLPAFLSRDWHPAGHCALAVQGGPWPDRKQVFRGYDGGSRIMRDTIGLADETLPAAVSIALQAEAGRVDREFP